MKDLQGRLAFITGGSSGVGLGLARACREAGMEVVVSYLTEEHLEEARSYLPDLRAFRLDVRDRQGLARIAEVLGPVDLLVNNAGVGIRTSILEAGEEHWDFALGVNLRGVINGVNAFVPGMLARGSGHVLTTASMSGLFAAGSSGLYTTTKYAVVGLMEALRTELGPRGIGVSVLCPGAVQSRVADWERHFSDSSTPPQPVGMEALECGRRALQGVRDNDLFILTHPEFRPGLEERHRLLEAAFPEEEAPEERLAVEAPVLRGAIYKEESPE